MAYKIMVVEDDKELAKLLEIYLVNEGYQVTLAFDGKTALQQWEANDFAMMIVDIMLPGLNGYEVIRRIREKSNIPMIITSAKTQEIDQITGLGFGADVYIKKPYNPMEVMAYVRAMLRRYYTLGGSGSAAQQDPSVIKQGELVLNQEEMNVYLRGEPVKLTATEYRMLLVMMQQPGRMWSKHQLCMSLHGDYIEQDEGAITVHMSRLRSKIEEDPNNPRYIKTVRGLGYRFEEQN